MSCGGACRVARGGSGQVKDAVHLCLLTTGPSAWLAAAPRLAVSPRVADCVWFACVVCRAHQPQILNCTCDLKATSQRRALCSLLCPHRVQHGLWLWARAGAPFSSWPPAPEPSCHVAWPSLRGAILSSAPTPVALRQPVQPSGRWHRPTPAQLGPG